MRSAEMRPWFLGAACALALLGMMISWKTAGKDEMTSFKSSSRATSDTGKQTPHAEISSADHKRQKKPATMVAVGTSLASRRQADRSLSDDRVRTKGRLSTGLSDSTTAPWTIPGQCIDAEAWGDRVSYFSQFIESSDVTDDTAKQTPTVKLRVHPQVSQATVAFVREALSSAELIANHYKEDLVPPDLYVHASVEDLREHACVASSAQSYYDGAIHVAVLEQVGELEKCVLHEYAHHLLSELGVNRPIWLHEGFAQRFASETTGSRPSSDVAVDQLTMATPLSTASTEEELAAFYEQSSDMLEFLNRLPSLTGARGYRPLIGELMQALANSKTDAEGLFVWATIKRGKNVFTGNALRFWEQYLEAGGFDSDTLAKIENEQRTRQQQESR